jgi:hypothetical protein
MIHYDRNKPKTRFNDASLIEEPCMGVFNALLNTSLTVDHKMGDFELSGWVKLGSPIPEVAFHAGEMEFMSFINSILETPYNSTEQYDITRTPEGEGLQIGNATTGYKTFWTMSIPMFIKDLTEAELSGYTALLLFKQDGKSDRAVKAILTNSTHADEEIFYRHYTPEQMWFVSPFESFKRGLELREYVSYLGYTDTEVEKIEC